MGIHTTQGNTPPNYEQTGVDEWVMVPFRLGLPCGPCSMEPIKGSKENRLPGPQNLRFHVEQEGSGGGGAAENLIARYPHKTAKK